MGGESGGGAYTPAALIHRGWWQGLVVPVGCTTPLAPWIFFCKVQVELSKVLTLCQCIWAQVPLHQNKWNIQINISRSDCYENIKCTSSCYKLVQTVFVRCLSPCCLHGCSDRKRPLGVSDTGWESLHIRLCRAGAAGKSAWAFFKQRW